MSSRELPFEQGRIRPSPVARRLASHPAIQNLSSDCAEIFLAPAFLTQRSCAELMTMTDASNRPSEIADSNGDAMFRTSSSSDLEQAAPAVDVVRRHIAHLLGLPLTHGEPLQAQRYQPGQSFKLHCDWFRPDSDDFERYCVQSGQRTWTAMAYLNPVEEGGETDFPSLGLTFRPQAGNLLMWNNQSERGDVNPLTAHHARPVTSGVKYVITQWFRERPYA